MYYALIWLVIKAEGTGNKKNIYMATKSLLIVLLAAFFSTSILAQEAGDIPNGVLANRVSIAPRNVLSMFRQAGMDPVNHELTESEKEKVEKAFATLPPLHQKILKEHLLSISFMDNMPNTALTSPVATTSATKMFNITFRAGILSETISEWATWKENTCFERSTDPEFEISIDAGELDAIQYVLLHEATHVVDAVLTITPHPNDSEELVDPTPFTKNIWYTMNVPTEAFINPLLEKTRFRSGNTVAISSAPEIYGALQETPFVSLYGMASWFEDIAELVTIYHLTDKLDQPFRISVRKHNREVASFEPMKNKLVKKRLKQIKTFY
ncbi:hypothetical protein SAMN05421740_102217 [Parapedobacter koreensis]|uniref:Uncharacterized protein n=2 Tax=Parapedobacter koreensis TaxID=332977 RepID=A0A1H7IHU1_9SPHI|nr:hypothetical protein SAMN05421740_102217 [Parapedobacter koreensis]